MSSQQLHNNPVWVVIPARYGSTRLPAKPLVKIGGQPMIEHVYKQARQAKLADRVIVATDHPDIQNTVKSFGGEVVLTKDCHSGSDRVAQAVEQLETEGIPPRWIVNVQGDEPLINPQDIDTLIGEGQRLDVSMATLYHPCPAEQMQSEQVVKVVLDAAGRALYFSRAPIPFSRAATDQGLQHMGIYLFSAEFLKLFVSMPPSPLAQQEQLEQLRALENGHAIYCFLASSPSVGVDVQADVELVEQILAKKSQTLA